jgi:peptidoglycan/LPS O-acetylase OafA/YrhL
LTKKAIYRTDIQILRGIAVLAVILFHSSKDLFPMGYLGVDVFFVISGFVVTPLIIKIFQGKESYFKPTLIYIYKFLRKRFLRLAPALAGTLLFSSIIIFLFGNINDYVKFAKQGIATLLLVGNLGAYKYNIDYFSPNPNPLVHTWSLAVEEQIYIVLPLLCLVMIMIFNRFKKSYQIYLYGVLAMGVFSFISFVSPGFLQNIYSLIGIQQAQQFSFYSAFSRIWQFLLGGIISILFNSSINKEKALPKIFSITAIVAICLSLFFKIQFETKMGSILVSLLTVFIIAFASLSLLPFCFRKILIWLGDRSYSLYLLHMPILYTFLHSPFFELGSNIELSIRILLGILFTLILGNLCYLKLENRFREIKHLEPIATISKSKASISYLIVLALFIGIYKVGNFGLLQDLNRPTTNAISPQDWDANCKFHQPSNPPRFKPCQYLNGTFDKNFLLIGDSHAGHLSKTIIKLGRKKNANVFIFTHAACPFIINPVVFSNKDRYPLLTPECLGHNRLIINFVKEAKIDTVFYSQRSIVPYVMPFSVLDQKNFNNFIEQSLVELKKSTNNLIFIGITPEYISVDSLVLKLLDRKGFYNEIPYLDNEYWRDSLSGSELKYVDLYKKFCVTKLLCKNKLKGEWLFIDNDHLSQAGGRFITPEILRTLNSDN